MRTFLSGRVWPFVAIFGCVLVLNGVAATLLFSRGYAFMVSPAGLCLGVVLTMALGAACGAALSRTKGLDRDAAGLRLDARAAVELLAATAGSFVSVLALLAALSATGLGALRWKGIAPAAVLLTIAASVVNAAFQQLGLQSLGLAARGPTEKALGASALTLTIFVATHAQLSQAPVYLLNVALFGALTIALFFGPLRRSYAAPSGFHGGWNAALMLTGALPESDAISAAAWSGRDSPWTGGAHGPESGLMYTLALAAIGAAVAFNRRRVSSGGAAPR